MKKIGLVACAFALTACAQAGVDFPVPEEVRSWDAPDHATNGVRAVWLEGAPWKGRPTRVFAYYGLPAGASAAGKVPGIVLVHGGGGTAFHRWVRLWNDRGYAAIAMDTCGGVPGGAEHSMRHMRHEWSGPNGWGCFNEEREKPEDQWMYHAVEAVVRSHTFLRGLPEVDAARIGVTGISWGGVLTSVVCGVDPRFAFAAPVYGCGNLRRHSVWTPEIGERWNDLWDPAQYAKRCRCPTLWCTGTNDRFFPLDSLAETALAAGNALFSVKVRMPHGHPPAGDPPEIAAFADSIVRGAPKLTERKVVRREWVSTDSNDPVWEKRRFTTSPDEPVNGTVFFENRVLEGGLVLSSAPSFRARSAFGAEPAFVRLAPGEVRPSGWLKDWCRTLADGMISHLDEYDVEFRRAWSTNYTPTGLRLGWHAQKNPKTGVEEPGFWSAEGGSYWMEGLVPLAWQLDDPNLKKMVFDRLMPIVGRMHPDALSFCWWVSRKDKATLEAIDSPAVGDRNWLYGPCGVLARAFCDLYLATKDERILKALEFATDDPSFYGKCYPSIPSAAWEICRLGAMPRVAAAFDAYCRTRLPDEFFSKGPGERNIPVPHAVDRLWYWEKNCHGVFVHEALMSLLRCHLRTGDRRYLGAVREWISYMDGFARLPTGVPVADEGLGLAGGYRGTETCDVSLDLMLREELLAVTGEAKWGDDAERNFFNATAGMASRDFTRHCYIQVPNMTNKTDSLVLSSGDAPARVKMRRTHFPLCCTASAMRNLPSFVKNMWMRSADGGLVAALWAPCEVRTQVGDATFAARVRTDYPFGETIDIRIDESAGAAEMPLHLRVPGWCASPSVSVDGRPVRAEVAQGFVRLSRTWRAGDVIRLEFPMRPRLERGTDRNVTPAKPWASVVCGPLLFALGIPDKGEDEPADPAFRTSCRIDPETALRAAEVIRRPLAGRWTWDLDSPVRVRVTESDGRPLELVPYGCTRLRLSMFPVAERAGESQSVGQLP